MRIGIFTKFEMIGGSELRAKTLANTFASHGHKVSVFAERGMPDALYSQFDKSVTIYKHALSDKGTKDPAIFYELDKLIVINTDSNHFTKIEYWHGQSERHDIVVDIKKIPQMSFIFNFIVSPARHLHDLNKHCKDVRIFCTNNRFYNEISTKDKHTNIRHLPRFVLHTPIDTELFNIPKTKNTKIRIGKHSKGLGSKWNDEHDWVIKTVNDQVGDKIEWDFMGASDSFYNTISSNNNVKTRKDSEIPVPQFLSGIDIFLFFIEWNRNEPFARAVGEAMASSCPIIATKDGAGNEEQVTHGNNGYLCKTKEEVAASIIELVNSSKIRTQMGKNSRLYSLEFSSENIYNKLMRALS